MENKRDFIEGIHYKLEEGRVIFLPIFHIERGYCCGCQCLNCPYNPRHVKNTKKLQSKFDISK
jgi:hypothetical protein